MHRGVCSLSIVIRIHCVPVDQGNTGVKQDIVFDTEVTLFSDWWDCWRDSLKWILKIGKWSEISDGIMPERSFSELLLSVKILSMRVAEWLVIRVGLLIRGDIAFAKLAVIKSLVRWWVVCFNRSIL